MRPDIAIIDGTLGLQGNGPGGTNSVQLGIAVASGDVFAADAVTSKAMGFEPMDIGLLNYANELGYGTADLNSIEIIGPDVDSIAIPFKPHETAELQLQWHDDESREYLAAD